MTTSLAETYNYLRPGLEMTPQGIIERNVALSVYFESFDVIVMFVHIVHDAFPFTVRYEDCFL